jgi:hypothetical protein
LAREGIINPLGSNASLLSIELERRRKSGHESLSHCIYGTDKMEPVALDGLSLENQQHHTTIEFDTTFELGRKPLLTSSDITNLLKTPAQLKKSSKFS